MFRTLVLIYFDRPPFGHTIKRNFITIQTVDLEIGSILISYKGSGPTFYIFVHNFSKKIFLILYSINRPSIIVWLPVLLKILDNICIVTICCPVCHVTNFENHLTFLINPFFWITKNSRQKFKISRKKIPFNTKYKAFFLIFLQGLSLKLIKTTPLEGESLTLMI